MKHEGYLWSLHEDLRVQCDTCRKMKPTYAEFKKGKLIDSLIICCCSCQRVLFTLIDAIAIPKEKPTTMKTFKILVSHTEASGNEIVDQKFEIPNVPDDLIDHLYYYTRNGAQVFHSFATEMRKYRDEISKVSATSPEENKYPDSE